MVPLDRVKSNVNCCGIALCFSGTTTASAIAGWQPFYNETTPTLFDKTYASISSIEFSEESLEVNGNDAWKIKVSFRFPSNDKYRAERLALMKKILYVQVLLNNGKILIVGRNDYFQNTKPKNKVKSNQQTTEVELEVLSMSPAGFTPASNAFGLPTLIPLTLVDDDA